MQSLDSFELKEFIFPRPKTDSREKLIAAEIA